MFEVQPPEGATIHPEFNAMECATLRHLLEIGMRDGDPLLMHGIRSVGEKLAVATLQAMPPEARAQIPQMIEKIREELREDDGEIPEDVREKMAEEIGDLVARLEAAADEAPKLDEAEVEAFDADDLLDRINAEAEEADDDSHD